MCSAAKEAKAASERAMAQAAWLKEEQERTSKQMAEVFTAQAEDTQKRIQSAMKVAIQTQQEVSTLSALARTADLTAKITAEQVERKVATVQQQMEEQRMLSAKEAEVAKMAQATITQ